MNEDIEMLRLMARLKLQVRRELNQSVDLGQMKCDPSYAQKRLSEIEEETGDEELLVLVLRLREMLVPSNRVTQETPSAGDTAHRYMFGARS